MVVVLLLAGLIASFVLRERTDEDTTPETVAETPAVETRAIVDVRSTPPGGRVLVDGELRAESTPAEIALAAGTPVVVTVEFDGYRAFTQTVTPPADGSSTTVQAALGSTTTASPGLASRATTESSWANRTTI